MPGRAQRRLTKAVVEALVAPGSGSVYLGDSEVPGFAVRVCRGPRRVRRTYVYRFADRGSGRGAGRQHVTIGLHGGPWTDPRTGRSGKLTCEIARGEALRLRGLRNAGGDVKAGYRAAPLAPDAGQVPTLREFSATYMTRHSNVDKATAEAKADQGRLDNHILPMMGRLPLDSIGPEHVTDLKAALHARPITANRCLALVSHIFTMAGAGGKRGNWRVLPAQYPNPCSSVNRFPENKRERYLTPEELGRVGQALEAAAAAHGSTVAALRVLMFTGARPTEIVSLPRESLRFELVETVVKGKVRKAEVGIAMVMRKGRQLPIRFPADAVKTVKALPDVDGNAFLFPDPRRVGRHITRWHIWQLWAKLRKVARCPDVRPYDVRHTFASVALADGASLEFIGGLLGHSNPRTTQRYAHLARAAEPIRQAGESAAREIARALRKR